jgi:hypothetical protein
MFTLYLLGVPEYVIKKKTASHFSLRETRKAGKGDDSSARNRIISLTGHNFSRNT